MQLHYEQLIKLLGNKPLAPIYFVSGDEKLLVQMACDHIRNSVKKQNFSEREVFFVEASFDWHMLFSRVNNYSLFSEKQLIELHLSQNISELAAKTLETYASDPPPDKILLIITGKLDRRLLQTTWFKSIDKIGVSVFLWRMESYQLFQWIIDHLTSYDLKAERGAIQYLISVTEGNLLACTQEIEKLSLYLKSSNQHIITYEIMMEALSDSTRFDTFKLTDTALQGDLARCLKILKRLKEEGTEPLLVLWSLSRECRQLASLAFQLTQGQCLKTIFQKNHIWEKRQSLLQKALQNHSLVHWHKLLNFATKIDHVLKGVEPGNSWQMLQTLSFQLAGIKII